LAKRSLGDDEGAAYKPAKKRRRVKTLISIMHVNNMLIHMAGKTLKNYSTYHADGSLKDPFEWEHLNCSPDCGADMVCFDHYLAYEKELNVSSDPDLSHGCKNAGKNALQETNLWKHVVAMSSASNLAYGSTLSPPRLQQIRENAEEYFGNPETDEWFQVALPHLVHQLKLDVDITDPSCAKVVCLNQ
jgi:hypothetical protein